MVEILQKEMMILTNTVQKQSKEIETLKDERSTVNCDCYGNNDDNDTAVFNNTTFQGSYRRFIQYRFWNKIQFFSSDYCTNEQIQSNMELAVVITVLGRNSVPLNKEKIS